MVISHSQKTDVQGRGHFKIILIGMFFINNNIFRLIYLLLMDCFALQISVLCIWMTLVSSHGGYQIKICVTFSGQGAAVNPRASGTDTM